MAGSVRRRATIAARAHPGSQAVEAGQPVTVDQQSMRDMGHRKHRTPHGKKRGLQDVEASISAGSAHPTP